MINLEIKIGDTVTFNWDGEILTGIVSGITDDKYIIKKDCDVYMVPKRKLLQQLT